jgi:hypothetical protein
MVHVHAIQGRGSKAYCGYPRFCSSFSSNIWLIVDPELLVGTVGRSCLKLFAINLKSEWLLWCLTLIRKER